jgi:hypothetical protein
MISADESVDFQKAPDEIGRFFEIVGRKSDDYRAIRRRSAFGLFLIQIGVRSFFPSGSALRLSKKA